MTGGGNPCLSFEISETDKAILQPLKKAFQKNQARINSNPLT